MIRLPIPGQDSGQWGELLNQFLHISHHENGELKNMFRVYNVLDYIKSTSETRATTSNTEDCTSGIQAAIDAAAGRVGGGVVFFPEGEYITCKLKLPSNITIIGTGFNSVLKLKDQTSDALFTNEDWEDGNKNIVIRNLRLEGNRDNNKEPDENSFPPDSSANGQSHAINFRYVSDSLLENLYITDFYFDGIYLGTSVPNRNPDVDPDPEGDIEIIRGKSNGSNRNIVQNNYIVGNGRNGISITRGSGNLIHNNIVQHNNKAAPTWQRPPEKPDAKNPFEAGAIDIEPNAWWYDTSRNIVTGNQVINNHFIGIQVLGRWMTENDGTRQDEEKVVANTRGTIIASNVISDSEYHGIAVVTSHLVIQANYVTSNKGTGIALGNNTGVKDSSIFGNIVCNNNGHGILINGSDGERIIVTGNICVSNGTTGNDKGIAWDNPKHEDPLKQEVPPRQVVLVGNIALNNSSSFEISASGADPVYVSNLTGELGVAPTEPGTGRNVEPDDIFSKHWRMYDHGNELYVENLQTQRFFKLLLQEVSPTPKSST